MKVIGHRGTAGLALENTLESFRLALDLGVDGVEFDVRITRDGNPVVCHDEMLNRISDSAKNVSELTYAQLKKIKLLNGARVPLLSEVLELVGNLPVIVEIKVSGHTEAICRVFDAFPGLDITVASFHQDVIADMRRLRPRIPLLLAENQNPFAAVRAARRYGAGLDLNHGLLNPYTYWQSKRYGFRIMVYTVNNPIVGWFIQTFYPRVWICTNHPERFLKTPTIVTVPED